jgi:hypothetical protein
MSLESMFFRRQSLSEFFINKHGQLCDQFGIICGRRPMTVDGITGVYWIYGLGVKR